jgi:cephalosporin hydroxylase
MEHTLNRSKSAATVRIVIDTEAKTLAMGEGTAIDLYGRKAFELISLLWLKTSWNQKYSYTFTWMGRPLIQHPEDILRLQEVIYILKPDVIIETGIAHGGSLVFYATLLKGMGKRGRVIGIDVEIRFSNREAIEKHELSNYITLIEGDSVAPGIVQKVGEAIRPNDTVLVLLDSNHSYAHVMKELNAYHPFVTPGSYIVVTDGIMQLVHDVPRGRPEWLRDNPKKAAEDFVRGSRQFVIEQPAWAFNESSVIRPITAWPSAYLKRLG